MQFKFIVTTFDMSSKFMGVYTFNDYISARRSINTVRYAVRSDTDELVGIDRAFIDPGSILKYPGLTGESIKQALDLRIAPNLAYQLLWCTAKNKQLHIVISICRID